MGKTGYIIQSLGYEYDDETYTRGDGGTPEAVIIDRNLAKKKMLELEIESWRNTCVGHYGYELDDIAKDEQKFSEALKDLGIDSDDYEMEIPKEATDEQIMKLIKYSKIRFHEIIEIEIEGIDEPTVEDVQPTEEMLSMQENTKKSSGIFDSVDDFTSGDVKPTIIPEVVTAVDIKEVVKETEDNFLAIKEEMKRLRDEARSKVKNFFIKGMDIIFDTYPEVKSVSWTQYTPYFNDGEPCEFWCNSGDFGVNGFSDYSDEGEFEDSIDVFADGEVSNYEWNRDENGRATTKIYNNPEARSVKIYKAISGFMEQLDDDDFKTMFGDHVEVTVRKGEITIDEYEHD